MIHDQRLKTVVLKGKGPTSVCLDRVLSHWENADVWTLNDDLLDVSHTHFDMHEDNIHQDKPHCIHVTHNNYPLGQIVRKFNYPYFRTTPAYMVALALLMNYEVIVLVGVDYAKDDPVDREGERENCQEWLAIAMSRGVQVLPVRGGTLFNGDTEYFYGKA